MNTILLALLLSVAAPARQPPRIIKMNPAQHRCAVGCEREFLKKPITETKIERYEKCARACVAQPGVK